MTYVAHKKLPPRQWSPSKFWSQGGPLIDKMKVDVIWEWDTKDQWTAMMEPNIKVNGETSLQAAMRAIVAHHSML